MMTADKLLDRYFLEVRSKLLEVAATLDRIDRASGAEQTRVDPRREKIAGALEILGEGNCDDRAERLQLLFSRDYDPAWLEASGL